MQQPFFIIGSGRSGTTFLYKLLQNHPRVALTNEARVADFLNFCREFAAVPAFQPKQFVLVEKVTLHGIIDPAHIDRFVGIFTQHALAALEEFYRETFPDRAFTHWGDKLPDPLTAVAFQAAYPHTRYLLSLRDPRDVACSIRAYAERASVKARYPQFGSASIREFAEYWTNLYSGAVRYLQHTLVVRYEELVRDPERILRGVLDFLGLEFRDDLLPRAQVSETFTQHGTAASVDQSIDRWRRDLAPADARVIEEVCGELMHEYGYALSS